MSEFHSTSALLDDLNEKQREAVLAIEGPTLVLAGAGTGKTRVITYRVAHLLESGLPPHAILAVTFTNKAAGVMKDRITELVRSTGLDATGVWVSTFHSFCARLLRREVAALGLPRDFAIYDDDDQIAAVKRALLQLNLSTDDYPPRSLRSQISHAKNHGITPDDMEAEGRKMHDRGRQDAAKVFAAYESILRNAAAVDFDDLLLRGVELLREHRNVREVWSGRFHYIMVDEFQDTNRAQEELVRLLSSVHKNVCVVGDEDQSIYGWRGARAGNLKRFTEEFPNAKVIRLEENYRSTQTILDAAAAVVEHNTNRLGKNLQATAGAGERLRFYEARDSISEAEYICGEIATLVRETPDAKVAVLYRTGAQSRGFEEILRRRAVRHRVVGGFSFYERAEVRNALAYVRLLFHPEDDVALVRVLNVPPRGIGATTIANLEVHAKEIGKPLWNVIGDLDFLVGKKFAGAIGYFRKMIEDLREEREQLSPAQLIKRVLDQTGYLDWVEQQDNLEHTSRADNLRELSNAMAEATEQDQTLEDLLDHAALMSDADEYEEDVAVSLMTLHSAKGLEFDAVFLAGLEEGVLPHARSIDSDASIEEERRLFYVGMTRAKRSLMLTRATYRRTWGEERLRASLPSRFLAEIPTDFIETAPGSQAEPGETRRYEPDPEYSSGYGYERSRPPYRQENCGRYGGSRSPYRRPATPTASPRASASASRVSSGRRASSSRDPLIGMRVRHSKYGVGTIIEVEGEDDDRKFTVSFEDYGPKKLLERYANLQPV